LAKYGIFADKLLLWGTGKPLREFLWSEEMADACVYVMENVDFDDLKGSEHDVRNTHINIGTGKELTIAELASLIKEEVGYEGHVEFDASKPDGTMKKLTDVSKLHQLGWTHKIEVKEGVSKMYKWYNDNLSE
jgi:GDP-L-fucose synthase